MKRGVALLTMLVRENLVAGEFARVPEERPAMDTEGQAEAWHAQGADDGPIVPVYHLNALACSRLAPAGTTVVDLGCGSGRYATYLARLRPDLTIVGLDLSAPMVDVGNQALRDMNLHDRVELRVGDMTAFARDVPAQTGLVNCLFALHHLPEIDDVRRCLAEIRDASARTGCGIWIFDLARPRHLRTATDYPRIFTPDAPEVFQLDSTRSLMAAWTHADLAGALEQTFGRADVHAIRARVLPLYQAFWRSVKRAETHRDVNRNMPLDEGALPIGARRQYRALRAILPGLTR